MSHVQLKKKTIILNNRISRIFEKKRKFGFEKLKNHFFLLFRENRSVNNRISEYSE